MKTCTWCKRECDVSEFHRSKREKDGLSFHCKECAAQYRKQSYAQRRKSNSFRVVGRDKSLGAKYPNILNEWDYTKNTADPFTVGVSSSYRAHWVCPRCSYRWQSSINVRTDGGKVGSCPVCSGKKILAGVNDVFTLKQGIAQWWSDTRHDPESMSAWSSIKVQFKCPEQGHVFTKRVRDFSFFCQECSQKEKSLGTVAPNLVNEFSEVNTMSAFEVSYNSAQRVDWVCSDCQHVWNTTVYQRVNSETGCPKCSERKFSSLCEDEISGFITHHGFSVLKNDRKVLDGKELDVFVPEKSFAIEFNGVYWHSDKFLKNKNYHYDKWQACRNKGIQLLTIWEDEYLKNPGIVKSMIAHKLGFSDKEKVYARKTVVKYVDYRQASSFLEKFHIQGGAKGFLYAGLFRGEELVAVSVWKRVNNRILSLERYATSLIVVGGMSKLLAHVIKNFPCDEVITFADHCVSDGMMYEKLGFSAVKQIRVDYKYVIGKDRVHKFSYRKKRFESDPDLTYVEGSSESELAELNGIVRIWDCGKTKYSLLTS